MKFVILTFVLAPFLMGAKQAQFEQRDVLGETKHLNSTVGTTATAVPAVADKTIAEALIHCPIQTGTKSCLFSFESSSGPFFTLREGSFVGWSAKGHKKQFWIKGNAPQPT